MADQLHFEQIYFNTYQKVLKYVVMHCTNLEDVNDIVQDSYIELYNLINKKKVYHSDDLSSFVIGITKNKMKDFYRRKNKFKFFSHPESDDDFDVFDVIADDVNIEDLAIKSDMIEEVWVFLRQKKVIVGKIFYLYYYLGMSIKEISNELEMTESSVKNYIYRTIKEMNNYFVQGVV